MCVRAAIGGSDSPIVAFVVVHHRPTTYMAAAHRYDESQGAEEVSTQVALDECVALGKPSWRLLERHFTPILTGLPPQFVYQASYELNYYAARYPIIDYAGHPKSVIKLLEEVNLLQLAARMGVNGKEFCVALTFDAAFVDAVCYSGCFPMAQSICEEPVMLVKLHKERSIMEDIALKLHIEKKTRKLSRRYEVTLDTAFEQVVEKVWAQHGHNWLFPVLARTFKRMHDANGSGEFRASVHSVEVWKQGELVSGELGFTIGGVYNSLTGFTGESNAGKVQLAALGELLALNGFSHWDLGMVMDYKLRLGAEKFPRARFLATHVRARDRVCQLSMPQTQPVNARDLLDRKLSLEAQETQ